MALGKHQSAEFLTEQCPDSGAKILALKTALKLALEMALDFLHWKKSENG